MAITLFGGHVPYTRATGTSNTFAAVTRRRGRIGDLPFSRIWPQHLVDNLDVLRTRAKWLTRNNVHAAAVARDLAHQIVGATGILPGTDEPAWLEWAEDPVQCDEHGQLDLYGLEWLALRSVVVTGEAFIVRRPKRVDSRWPIPMQIDVFDGDSLAYGPVTGLAAVARGSRMQQGIEYSLATGRRRAYHFRVPSRSGYAGDDVPIRVQARDVIHLYEPIETGMERGVSWFAPALLELSDLGAFETAILKRAELQANIAAITSRAETVDAPMLPSEDDDEPMTPGYELRVTPGSEVRPFPNNSAQGIKDFSQVVLSGIASALGTTVEDLTGNYNMPFSAAKLSWLKQAARVRGIRRRVVRPGVRRLWGWVREAAAVRGMAWPAAGAVEWPDPPVEEIDEGEAVQAAVARIRAGLSTISEEIRRRGKVPKAHLDRVKQDFEVLTALGLFLDIDPRVLSAQGQAQSTPGAGAEASDAGGEGGPAGGAPPGTAGEGEGEDGEGEGAGADG